MVAAAVLMAVMLAAVVIKVVVKVKMVLAAAAAVVRGITLLSSRSTWCHSIFTSLENYMLLDI